MNKELIEKLKNNLSKFEENTREEQTCFEEVGKENCEVLLNIGTWRLPVNIKEPFEGKSRYRIKSDYNPEPEYIDIEITVVNNDRNLGANIGSHLGYIYGLVYLYQIPSIPNFEGFFAKDDKTSTEHFVHIDGVAKSMKDHKVFARFEK